MFSHSFTVVLESNLSLLSAAMAADATKAELPPTATSTAPTVPSATSANQDLSGLLIAKSESSQQQNKLVNLDAPTVVDTTLLGPDSMVEKFSDGSIYVTTAGTKEKNSVMLYQIFFKQNMRE